MRWIKHLTRARDDQRIAAYKDRAKRPCEAYGFYWTVLEIVGESVSRGSDKCTAEFTLGTWARMAQVHVNTARSLFVNLAECGLISIDNSGAENLFKSEGLGYTRGTPGQGMGRVWVGSAEGMGRVWVGSAEGIVRVRVPNLLKYRDEYSKKSGHYPDTIRSKETETETETETEQSIAHPSIPPLKSPANVTPSPQVPLLCKLTEIGEIIATEPDPPKPRRPQKTRPENETDSASGFSDFWARYPKKRSKADARKAWVKLAPSADLQTKIQTATQTATTSQEWCHEGGKYIPLPATWLRRGCWDDETFTPTQEMIDADNNQRNQQHNRQRRETATERARRQAERSEQLYRESIASELVDVNPGTQPGNGSVVDEDAGDLFGPLDGGGRHH